MKITATRFKDLGIAPETNAFTGDKMKIGKILNKEIIVHDFKIVDSKYKGKCLHLQIKMADNMHVVFTGSSTLMDMIQKVPKEHFPFITTVIEENERYQFT